jgi:3-dehydrosphinganine reductase
MSSHALITGGSSGIGLALAARLAASGLDVTIIARKPEGLAAAKAAIAAKRRDSAQRVLTFAADVTDEAGVTAAIQSAIATLGPPHVLVTSAGMVIPGRFDEMPVAAFRSTMEANYFGTLYAIRAGLPAMRTNRGGQIVLISSGAGLLGIYGLTAYSPTKFAVRGLAEALRSELAPDGIGVSVVYPPDTDTPQLHELRRQTIELLFSERNHICPFCPASGQCELQNAAYGHSIDHVRYDYCFPMLEMDNSHRYIALDHNRCILCTRCIRACDEWVGAHILDTDHRGLATMLIADNGIPLGESKCVSCGACVTVCPTGALFEKRSAHWQGRLPLKQAETICVGCGVGCRISASVCHRQIGEINSAGGPSGNRVLCERGRFGLVDPSEPRLNAITMRRGSERVVRSLDDALAECVRRLSAAPVQADPDRVIGLMSPRLPLETLAASRGFLTNVVGSTRWSLMDRTNTTAVREGLGINGKLVPLATLHELDEADLFLLVGCNLERSHGVVASYVRRAALHRRARLVKINPRHTWLTDWTDLYLPVERGKDAFVLSAILKYLIEMGRTKAFVPQELADQLRRLDDDTVHALTGLPAEDLRKAARMYAEAERPMIICGVGLSRSGPQGLAAAMNLVRATGQKSASGRARLDAYQIRRFSILPASRDIRMRSDRPSACILVIRLAR